MTVLGLLSLIGRILFLYTLGVVCLQALRRRDPSRFDIVPLILLLGVWLLPWGPFPLPLALRHTLMALLPLSTLLIVRHFRIVPAQVPILGWLVPTLVVVGAVVWGLQVMDVTRWAIPTYLGFGVGAVTFVLASEALRAEGVQNRRIGFAAAAMAVLLTSYLASTVVRFATVSVQIAAFSLNVALSTAANLFLFLAFAPPRFVVARWRRTHQASYLAAMAEREPEERGLTAAQDLLDAARRCVGGGLIVVARPRMDGSERLVIRACSERELVGNSFVCDDLLARVYDHAVPASGRAQDCGPLGSLLARYGRFVLVAPIRASARTWGLVITVHPKAPLFPDDDLLMLEQLGRSAATAFDHAALIVERREQARRATDSRLRELQTRVGLMLDSMRDYAMLVLDDDGVVVAWHAGAEAVFGYTHDQIRRHSGALLFDVTPQQFASWLAHASAHGKMECEVTCRRPDGRTFTGITTIRPLVVEPGQSAGYVVVTQDITDRRALEERLHHGQKMQAIGQLAGGIAHDFNNLLTAIVGYADWLDRDLSGDPRREQVAEIRRAAERASNLTRQLLAFSRRQVVQPTSLDLTRLIQDLLPMLRRLIGARIEVVDETAPLLHPVLGDRSQMEQVVINLVLNARDAMPNGGRVTIRTSDVELGGDTAPSGLNRSHVLLEVSDTGIGMDAETRRRVFEPFFTTKPVGQGTGLGLATVYGTVQHMGGLIEVDSAPGRGATFRLYLPHATGPFRQPERPAPQPVVTGRETLLLIEDDDALRHYLVHVLEGHGYEVIAAEGPEAALAVAEDALDRVDLVISDIIMPGMSGIEVVAELAQMRPGLPTLFISGSPEEPAPITVTGRSSPTLQKPFSSTELLTKVREILSVA